MSGIEGVSSVDGELATGSVTVVAVREIGRDEVGAGAVARRLRARGLSFRSAAGSDRRSGAHPAEYGRCARRTGDHAPS